ncbi:MAG TPA: hypothetical protein VL361_07140 [Candidatus Limnocylindrales bacterium]|jgi:hypothetical protein|nr:hypothetical protein [Candidatus Limnocylindrales bacterium]
MQDGPICPPLNCASTDADSSFNVVIAYEDFESGKHAKKTYDFLVENLGRDCRFTNQMWKFDVLMLPKLRDIAVEDAATADIIMISSNGGDLPDHVKAWIDAWLPIPPSPLALVALFARKGEEERQVNSAQRYLAQVAQKGNMEFFAEPEVWPGRENDKYSGDPNRSRFSENSLSSLAGFVQRDVSSPRWNVTD